MRKLHMTFLNEDGSKKTLVIHCVHQDLSPEAVREAMVQITELNLFEKDGVRLMTEVYSAKYVEVIETPLFNVNEILEPTLVEEVKMENTVATNDDCLMDAARDFPKERDKKRLTQLIALSQKSLLFNWQTLKQRGQNLGSKFTKSPLVPANNKMALRQLGILE